MAYQTYHVFPGENVCMKIVKQAQVIFKVALLIFGARPPPAALSRRSPTRVGRQLCGVHSHPFWTRVPPVLWACSRVRCWGGSLDVMDGHTEMLPPHGQPQSSGLEQQDGAGGRPAS